MSSIMYKKRAKYPSLMCISISFFVEKEINKKMTMFIIEQTLLYNENALPQRQI